MALLAFWEYADVLCLLVGFYISRGMVLDFVFISPFFCCIAFFSGDLILDFFFFVGSYTISNARLVSNFAFDTSVVRLSFNRIFCLLRYALRT